MVATDTSYGNATCNTGFFDYRRICSVVCFGQSYGRVAFVEMRCQSGRYEYVVSTEIPAGGTSPDILVPASCAEPGTNRVVVYDKEKEIARFDCINWEVKNSNALHYESVDLDTCMNARVTDIFENRYLSPRSPYTTLQVPVQGIGEWCHPKATAEIDDSGLRRAASGDVLDTPIGVPFRIRQDTDGEQCSFYDLLG